MAENKGSWLSEILGGGEKTYIEGIKAEDAAKGSGIRAEEAQKKAAEEARIKADEAIKEFNRQGSNPNDLKEVERKIELYRRLKGIK